MNERIEALIDKMNKSNLIHQTGNYEMTITNKDLEYIAELIEAQEREKCAKLAETTVCDIHLPTGTKIYGSRVATAIRARGTT